MVSLIQVDTSTPLPRVFGNMDGGGDQWKDADLISAISYVRKSKQLKIPEEFRSVIDS